MSCSHLIFVCQRHTLLQEAKAYRAAPLSAMTAVLRYDKKHTALAHVQQSSKLLSGRLSCCLLFLKCFFLLFQMPLFSICMLPALSQSLGRSLTQLQLWFMIYKCQSTMLLRNVVASLYIYTMGLLESENNFFLIHSCYAVSVRFCGFTCIIPICHKIMVRIEFRITFLNLGLIACCYVMGHISNIPSPPPY